MLSVVAVRQLAAQQHHGKLDKAHDHGNEGNGGGGIAQLVFEDQRQQRPDQGPHAGNGASPEKYINLPAQMPVLVQKFG